MDKISEEIAHFIGSWNLASEEARSRHDYHAFRSREASEPAQGTPEVKAVTIKAPFDFEDYDPALPYVAPDPVQYWAFSGPVPVPAVPLQFEPWPSDFFLHAPRASVSHASGVAASRSGTPEIDIAPPGSVAAIIDQRAFLSDQDNISLGGHSLRFDPILQAHEALQPLLDKALSLSPLGETEMPGSVAEMKALVETVTAALRDASPVPDSSGDGFETVSFTAHVPSLSGTYVNGLLGADVPDFATYRPAEADEPTPKTGDDKTDFRPSFREGAAGGDGGETASGSAIDGAGPFMRHSSIDLQMGDNRLVNVVELSSNWLAASVTAVMGDHVELNAIVQINTYADHDLVTATLGGAVDDAATLAFNLATFLRIDPSADDPAPVAKAFPSFWAVTEVKGDLLVMNWIEQINFMADGDIATLAAAGTLLKIVTGDNMASNFVSLAELGRTYDLIIVGGSVTDANIIFQTNILLDNDTIGAVGDFAGGAGSSLSSHGNLLWNEARIMNVGAADRFQALPDAFRQAAENLGQGDRSAPADLLKDEAFTGASIVRALYITGDMIDLQFVKQMNVLGDVDKVALAMARVDGDATADWTISTGHNTLVNSASILDVDSLGKTLVGGQTYSDEILIQTDIIQVSPQWQPGGADALVTEAVVFLGDGMLGPDLGAAHDGLMPVSGAGLPLGSVQADPMHALSA